MRRMWSVPVMLVLLAFAGCVEEEPAPDGGDDGTTRAPPTIVKEDFEASGSMAASADPGNIAGMGICSSPSAQCDRVPFTVTAEEAPLDLEATLAWMLPSNDLDLYLYADGQELSSDGINMVGDPPNNQQVLKADGLGAGDYEFVIVGWNAVGEEYHLAVTFA